MTIDEQVQALKVLDQLYVRAQRTKRPADWRRYQELLNVVERAMRVHPAAHTASEAA